MLIKTHAWSDSWQPPPSCACIVTLTHRDLRGVLASYQRMGWAYRINSTYVDEHQRWKVACNAPVSQELGPSCVCVYVNGAVIAAEGFSDMQVMTFWPPYPAMTPRRYHIHLQDSPQDSQPVLMACNRLSGC